MSEMMITADDYGPVKFINDGIEKALRNRCIDTVSVLMNPHTADAVSITQKIKKLKMDFPFVNIGIHLSITSGLPVNKPERVPSLLMNGTDFQYVHNFDYEKVRLDELEKELRAQIDLFPVEEIPIDHISCHHGILPLFKRFFKLYVDLANEIKVPIRQPIPISKMKIRGFRWSLMKRQGIFTSIRLLNDVDIDNLVDSLRHINKLEDLLKESNVLDVDCCKYFVDRFYRRASKKRLKKIFRKLPKDGPAELVVHLGDGHIPPPSVVPNGINVKHFQDKQEELDVLLSSAPSPMAKLLNLYSIKFLERKPS